MSSLIESIEKLNEKQREAVYTTEGPVLIAAGAGSGKTRVLTHRIAYLIQEKGINPWNILAITFTNKAANEMRERVEQLVGVDGSSVWVSTFHAMCARILRREYTHVGYDANFSIIDQSEQQTLMKRVLKELNLDSQRFNYKDFLYIIDDAKNKGKTPEMFAEEAMGYLGDIQSNVFRTYQAKLERSNAMDFNDLILLTVRLLQENDDVRSFYQRKFQYIHVDEYQDTNHSQYLLIQLLGAGHENVCVVGDADQSIYGWRGANMENILNFESDFPQATVIKLEQNYRSTQNILKAANSVIANNTQRQDKLLWSDKETGSKVQLYIAETDTEESRFVVQKILETREDHHRSYNDYAILYRTQAQSRSLEDALIKANVPYRVVGGLKFYARKEIQDTLAYLRLIDNPMDNLSFNRIVNVPKRGIGPTTIERLSEFATTMDLSWFQAIGQIEHSNLPRGAQSKLIRFAEMIYRLQEQAKYLSLSDLVEQVWEQSEYIESLRNEGTIEAETRIENLDELLSVTQEFDKLDLLEVIEQDPDFVDEDDQVTLDQHKPEDRLRYFLTELALLTDKEGDEPQAQVTLMTMHAAKGLEFPYVFVVGMEEGLFPLRRAMDSDSELEEERRLAYVAMTRAKEHLYLLATRNRLLYGRYQQNMPSRFVEEIDQDLVERIGQSFQTVVRSQGYGDRGAGSASRVRVSKGRPSFRKPTAKTRPKNENLNWQVGDKVDHRAWGTGTVVKVKDLGGDQQLSIAFESQGIKELLGSLAPISKVQ